MDIIKIVGKPRIELFYNQTNHYRIIKVILTKVPTDDSIVKLERGNFFTVVGTLPQIEMGANYEFTGTYTKHSKYGEQLTVTNFKKQVDNSNNGVISFLSGDSFVGIGRKTAEKIVETIGENTIQKIIDDKDILLKVPGFTQEKAYDFYQQLIDNYESERIIYDLVEMGLSIYQANSVVQKFQEKSITAVKENPYILLDVVEKISFNEVDRIALNLGVTLKDKIRLEAVILFSLKQEVFNNGNTYTDKIVLFSNVIKIIGSGIEFNIYEFEIIISDMSFSSKIFVEMDKVYLYSLFSAIENLSESISVLHNNFFKKYDDELLEETISKIEYDYGLKYGDLQRVAIKSSLNSSFSIITGGPGTGKTTIIMAIVKAFSILEDINLKYINDSCRDIALLAPTGRAAKKMEESTGIFASTIHRYLGFSNEIYTYHSKNKISSKLIIIDEFSMVDVFLANHLFSALELENVKVVIVGDYHQIPSIGPGTLLKNLVECESLHKVVLEKVFRQAEESSIIELAHFIKDGNCPSNILENQHDRRFFNCDRSNITDVVKQISSMSKAKGYSDKEIQVLSPVYRGVSGIDELNEQLQTVFNPSLPSKNYKEIGRKVFREKDKVLQLSNLPELGVMNGDIGYIEKIYNNGANSYITVAYDNNTIDYEKDDFDQFTHAYAMSIHKSQGGEWPIIIIVVSNEHKYFFTRKLLYTAISRAKSYLFIVGEVESFKAAIKNDKEVLRKTIFLEKLKNKIK